MRLTGLLLLFFSAILAVSCASSPEEEFAERPDFFRAADFVRAMENIAGALREGRVFIRDTEGYNRVFGFDNFRFTEKNVRPVSIFFLPETNRFHCAALVRDSGAADRPYRLVFFTGAAARGAPLSLVGVGKADRMYQRPPAVLPEPSVLRAVCEAMREKLRSGGIVWDQDAAANGDGAPGKGGSAVRKEKTAFYFLEQDWWRDCLMHGNGTLRLSERDLSLGGIAVSPEGEITLSCCVRPLTVRTTGRTISYATLNVVMRPDGTLLRTEKGGEHSFEDALSVILYPFAQKDNDEIYRAVFECLFERSASKVNGAAPAEKFRFLIVPETASPDFMTKYSWGGGLPVRNPLVHDWDLGIPFNEKAGRYTGLGNGEYYYSAGAIRPVDASTAYVMGSILCLPPSALSGKDAAKIREMPALEDASVRFNGPVGYLKLKKGFFGWYVERDSIAPLAKPSGEKTGNGKQKN